MQQYGGFFPDNPQTLDELLEEAAAPGVNGGVLVEIESISLSRGVPMLARPIMCASMPRQVSAEFAILRLNGALHG